MLAIRLEKEIEKRLNKLAHDTGRTKSFYVREAILDYLERMEDLYIAEKRLIDLHLGKSSTITIEEAMKEYDI